VIRYMRFRRGATNLFDRDDCLGGQPIGNIIVDHCSCSWGLDENLSMYRHVYKPKGATEFLKYPTLNITLQWNISSEALNTYGHAFGGTWGGNNTSFHHNLFACNTGRNPSIGMSYDFNFVDNVLFNWRHRTLDGGDQGSRVNCINNYYEPGPVTEKSVDHRVGLPQPSTFKPDLTERYGRWYAAGNVVVGNAAVTKDNWNGGIQFKGGGTQEDPTYEAGDATQKLMTHVRTDEPFPMAPIEIQSAKKARELVLANAGAMLPKRDSVDERAVRETRTGKVDYTAGKGIITDISQVGGYPDYQGEPIKDLGADGIPASWKTKFGLDINDTTLAQKDLREDGYTVMDKYLAGLDPTKKIDWSNPRSNVNTLQ
ncbi:MAG TPA: polysaccharide lyase, partial [Verrucomicrobiae bacterium]|nr:polysaccharide lyase [Verrucomicrobiae bacterium]